jgi:2-methylcitrate dehydratase PrpD
VSDPRTIHQSKFSMGFVLALIAARGSAGIDDFTEEALEDPELRGFSERVEMVFDPDVDAAYPQRWIGLVEIETTGGDRIISRVDVPKGDPGNTLSREEIEAKARSLAAFQGGASDEEMDRIIGRVWSLDREPDVRNLLPEA